jgi:hypothetical protein
MARRDRKKRTRKDPDASRRRAGGRVTVSNRPGAWKKALLDRDAPSPELPRELFKTLLCGVDDYYERRLAEELPTLDYTATGIAPDEEVAPDIAWPLLESLHERLVAATQHFAAHVGSAEWLWWLRRLRGQFHINDLDTTDPYVQHLAEALAAGTPRPSTPVPDVPRFVFPLDPERLLDITWMRHAAIQLYRLHATMKRCAKGQRVQFRSGDLPYAVPDEVIEQAIDAYDRRAERVAGSLLSSVGLHLPAASAEHVELGDTFGGVIPFGCGSPQGTMQPEERRCRRSAPRGFAVVRERGGSASSRRSRHWCVAPAA